MTPCPELKKTCLPIETLSTLYRGSTESVFTCLHYLFICFLLQHIFKYLQAEAIKKEQQEFLMGWKGFFKMVNTCCS